MKVLFRPDEIANILGYKNKSSVYKLIKSNGKAYQLPVVHKPNTSVIRIHIRNLREYLRNSQTWSLPKKLRFIPSVDNILKGLENITDLEQLTIEGIGE